MSLYLYHAPAVALYDTGIVSRPSESARCLLPDDHVPSFKDGAIQRMLEKLSIAGPMMVATPSAANRRNTRNLHSMTVCNPPLRQEFYQLSDQVFIATPELALLSVSKDMGLLELVSLVGEMCSRYTVDPKAEHGYRPRSPVTSKEQILRFLEPLRKHPGANSLLKATYLAIDNARSPAEAKCGLRLVLPRPMAGYDIERPTVNGTIELPPASLSRLDSREVDFLWEKQRLVAEYDSEERHGESTRSTDTLRANEISSAGYSVISIVPEQIATVTSMNQLVAGIAAHVYSHRTEANMKLLRQFILQPDEATYLARDDLRKELNFIFQEETWKIPLQRKQAKIAAAREAARARRRQSPQETPRSKEQVGA